MAVKQGPYIFINKDNLAEADFMSRNFVNKEIRNRAFINTLGAEALIKYLTTENVNLKNIRNIHSVARILEYIDIADIMMPNIHIDVRVVFDENQIFIPKSHFEYEIQPDIYVVLKLGENFEYFELLGFFEPRSLNTSHENSQYYFYENYKLSSPGHLVKFIKTYARRTPENITEEEILKGRELSVNLADHDITENEFKTLLQLMASSSELRDSILEYDNFETLSHRVALMLADSPLAKRPTQEVSTVETLVDTEDKTETEDDLASEDEQTPDEELTQGEENEQDEGNVEQEEESGEITGEEAEVETDEVEETSEELFGQDLTFDTENLDETSEQEEDVLPQVEDLDITDAEEEDDDDDNEQSEIDENVENITSENLVSEETEDNSDDDDNEADTLDFDTSFFEEQNNDEVLELTDDFFADNMDTKIESEEKDEPQNQYDDDGDNIVSNVIETAASVAGITAAAGAELTAGAAASAEAISLAAVAGNEIDDLEEESIGIFDEQHISTETNDAEKAEFEDLGVEENSELQEGFDGNFDEDLIMDETGADTADMGDLVETFDDLPLDTETTVNFDELETTDEIPQETQVNEEETANFEDFEDLSVVNQEELQNENTEVIENFTDFNSINEIPQANEPIHQEITDETHDFDTLTQMPETINVIPDPSEQESEIEEEAVNFADLDGINSESDIPTEINSEINSDSEILQDMPLFEEQENNDETSFEQNYELNSQESDNLGFQTDLPEESESEALSAESSEDFSYNNFSAPEDEYYEDDNHNIENIEDAEIENNDEESQPKDSFEVETGEEWETDTDEFNQSEPLETENSQNDFTFEDFNNEPEITDEDIPQQIDQEVAENSAPITNMEFNPGEIPIDINNNELTYNEAEHLESIYNESNNFQNPALNNSARFVRGGNTSQNGPSKLFVIVAGLLVVALLSVLGMSALNMFKPSAQEEPQPVTDNQFPEIPQSMEQTEAPVIDTSKVVTMNNTKPAPIAQPAVPSQTSGSSANKIPATSFLEISKLSWEVPDYISANANFKRYFQSAGKSLKAGLSSDLLLAKDFIYSKQMRLSITFDKNGAFKESRMLMSSGSTQIDNIVLQSVNQTLSVLKAPNSLGNDQSTTVILKIYF